MGGTIFNPVQAVIRMSHACTIPRAKPRQPDQLQRGGPAGVSGQNCGASGPSTGSAIWLQSHPRGLACPTGRLLDEPPARPLALRKASGVSWWFRSWEPVQQARLRRVSLMHHLLGSSAANLISAPSKAVIYVFTNVSRSPCFLVEPHAREAGG